MPLHTFDLAPLIYLRGYPFASARGVIDWVDGCLHDVQLTLHGDERDWLRIQAEGSFGFKPHLMGPILGGPFRPYRPFHFTIVLLPERVLTLAMCAESPIGVLKTLFVDSSYLPVARDPSSWRLLQIMQAEPFGVMGDDPRTTQTYIGASMNWVGGPAERLPAPAERLPAPALKASLGA